MGKMSAYYRARATRLEHELAALRVALAALRSEIVDAAEFDTQWEAVAIAAGWLEPDGGKTERSDMVVDAAFEVFREHTANDPDPVSMVTELDGRRHDISVVVLRGHEVIEMFRQWAERNAIYTRGNDLEGKPRT